MRSSNCDMYGLLLKMYSENYGCGLACGFNISGLACGFNIRGGFCIRGEGLGVLECLLRLLYMGLHNKYASYNQYEVSRAF